MKTCNEVMTKNPTCCLPLDSVSKAAQLMKAEDVGSIPVIENEKTKKLIGIVTDRDLALHVLPDEHNVKSMKVQDAMTHEVITCRETDDVQKAVDLMANHQLRRIPIVDHDHNIVGIISQADIATRVNKTEETAEMVKEISQPTT
jgi:CBS domain-containing protein